MRDADDAGFASIDAATKAIAAGDMVIVVDDPGRENEGDLVMAAQSADAGSLNFMATHGRGLVCVPMLAERLEALGIPAMAGRNGDAHGTAFHVGVDAALGTTTGISAHDRARTARMLADPGAEGSDFSRPGHLFPLAYRQGGVLRRTGHTEAAIDLCLLAGAHPAALICEIARADGEMARLPQLLEFAAVHDLPLVTISDLIAHRRRREKLVTRVSDARLPIQGVDFRALGYRDEITGLEHLALVLGDLERAGGVLVRVHSECVTGDVFGSARCDCGPQLDLALRMIRDEGAGVVVYLRGHEGRGIGLADKLHAYEVQDLKGLDTVDANLDIGHPVDRRDYGTGMQILADLEVRRMRLLTNNPAKRSGLEGYGLTIVDRVPLITESTTDNRDYLQTKQRRLGHLLALGEEGKSGARSTR